MDGWVDFTFLFFLAHGRTRHAKYYCAMKNVTIKRARIDATVGSILAF